MEGYEGHLDILSHPTWVCGLKQIRGVNDAIAYMSHPTWVCGLKHRNIVAK